MPDGEGKAKNDGGPAFPGRQLKEDSGGFLVSEGSGMSLRDYFAAVALQALLRRLPWAGAMASERETIYARAAYGMASAMLKERAKAEG